MSKPSTSALQFHSKQTASNASLFVTNLRLLDLDKYDDWPAILLQTLRSKDGQQDQKNRIRCVEWTLFRLFELWDPGEARNKLLPFFPPLEPLQSLNLRAALFRCLNELKKNGVLGRHVIIRKTMLDECKGDKFEEVLVAFSTIVLQKVLAAERNENPSIAKRLALARKVPLKDQESFLPLAVAHRASLTAVLRRKKLLKTRYSEFQHLLDGKERDLAQRTKRLEAIEESGAAKFVPNHASQGIRRQFDIHWEGDPRWVDVILKGGEHDDHDSLLETEFSELLPSIKQGTLHKATATAQQGLLQDLEKRIASQQARLQHWKAIKDDLIGTPKPSSPTKTLEPELSKPQGIEFDLSRHEAIIFDPRKPYVEGKAFETANGSIRPSMTDEYTRLVNSMEAELASVGETGRQPVKNTKRDRGSILPVPLRDRHNVVEPDHLNTFKRDSTQDIYSPVAKSSRSIYKPNENFSSQIGGGGDAKTLPIANRDPPPSPQESIEIAEVKKEDVATANNRPSSSIQTIRETKQTPTEPEVLNEDELLAQQIISSTRTTAPSPSKPKRSLVERTRQSMGFSSLSQPPLSPPPPLPPPPSADFLDPSPSLPAKATTLLERTRQSMSLMPANTLSKARKPRPSKTYPTNQFETPRKSQVTAAVGRARGEDTTPPEKLFAQEADYASVFKSRPRVGLSPAVSPELRKGVSEGEEGEEWEEWEEGGHSPTLMERRMAG